jgi:HSP90 family molecular chaperone
MLKLVARKIPQVLERRVLYPTKFSKRFSSLINIRLSTLNNEQFSSKFLNRGRNLSTAPESNVETREFRAETKQLLDIVTNSIYTDKEVFLRELISNASDALEKLRYKQVIGEIQTNDPLEIQITSNKNDKTLTIVDNGIGMSKEDLINNLGIIARSGSKQFIESIQNDASAGATTQSAPIDPHRIIGQFGVGFYSSFMIADTVTVESIPAVKPEEPPAQIHRWSSDGSGVFTIERLDELPNDMIRGTRIIIKLKEMHHDFLEEHKLKVIIRKYSNFISFPIKLNGTPINTISALWLQDKKDITPSQYKEFYKFVANAYDEPRYTLHFRTDVPIDLKVLLFVPNNHTEKFGSGQMERGVNLYSRKILIESKPEDLLPNWLRFMKGVVDSEDIPLSLSREKAQDSNLLRRIREVVTRRIIKHLEENMKEDIEKYKSFYLEFAYFLKEGVCSDSKFSEQVAKLLMFESSSLDAQTLTNLDEYISR